MTRPDGIMRRFFRNYAEFFPKLCGKNRKLCGNYADCAISFIIKFQCNKRSHWSVLILGGVFLVSHNDLPEIPLQEKNETHFINWAHHRQPS